MNTQATAYIVLGALVLVLVTGFILLTLNGRDTVSYTVFASGPIMSAIVGALLARRADSIASDVATVVHQTNGQLAGQFAAASDERQAATNRLVAAVAGPSHTATPPTPVPGEATSEDRTN